MRSQCNLPKVIRAINPLGRRFCLAQSRKKQRRQDADNGNHHQQLDQRLKARSPLVFIFLKIAETGPIHNQENKNPLIGRARRRRVPRTTPTNRRRRIKFIRTTPLIIKTWRAMIAMIPPAVVLRPNRSIQTNPFPTALGIPVFQQRRKPRLIINLAIILRQFKRKTGRRIVEINESRLLIAVKMNGSNITPPNPFTILITPLVDRTAITVPPIPRNGMIPIEFVVRDSLLHHRPKRKYSCLHE